MICHGKNRFGTAHHTPLPCHDRIPDKNSSFSLQESKYDFANPLSRKDALSRSALCAQWFYACPNQPHARDLRASAKVARRDGSAKEIFHPESLNLHLRVAAIDYAAQYIILPAFHAMKRIAPRISIELQQLNADTFRRLSLGLVDMAMRLECTAPNELHSLELYEAKLLALVRKGHPAFDLLRHKGSLHFDDLLQWEFVQVNRTFTGLEWTTSLHPGALNHPAVMVPYSSLLAPTILETDWIALASARYALDAVKRWPVAILPIRLDCVKRMRTLYWHDRTHLDPAMQWVRSMIAAYGKPSSAEIAEYEIAIQDTGNGS